MTDARRSRWNALDRATRATRQHWTVAAAVALLLVATGLTVAVARAHTEVVNAVPNPSFESGISGWYVPSQTSVRRAGRARYGSYAAKVAGPRFSGISAVLQGLHHGESYVASAWIRVERGRAGDLALEIRDPTNTRSLGHRAAAARSGWQRLVTRFEGTPRGIVYLRVVSYGPTRASFLMDAVQVQPGARAGPYLDSMSPGVDVLPRVEGPEAVRQGFQWPTAAWLQWLLVAATALVLGFALVRTARRRDFLLDPLLWLVAALVLMYVIRPVAMLGYDQMTLHATLDVSSGFTGALVAGFLGSAALLLGYHWSGAARLAGRLPRQTRPLSERTWIVAAGVMLVVAVTGSALYLLSTGRSPWSSLGGTEVDSASSTAYLYLAPYCAIPAAVILVAVAWSRRNIGLLGATLVLVAFLLYSYTRSGNRLWAMLLLTSLGLYALVRSGRRPRIPTVVAAGLVLFALISPLRDLTPHSSAADLGRALAHPWTHPGSEWKRFSTQSDTEMAAAISAEMQVVPSLHEYHPGNSIVTLLARPVPHIVWPGKPRSSDQVLNRDLFGAVGYKIGDAGPAYSAVGDFYYDSGFAGIVVGMFLVGAAFRLTWAYWRRNESREWARISLALLLPFTVVLLRGNAQDTGTRVLFVLVPVLVVPGLAALVSHLGTRMRSRSSTKVPAEEVPNSG